MSTDPTSLLRQAETYLTVTHEQAARHDVLGESFTCAGCTLRKRITVALAAQPAVSAPPADQNLRDEVLRALDFNFVVGTLGYETPEALLAAFEDDLAKQTAPKVAEVWSVWAEDESALGRYSDEVTAKLAAIEAYQEAETPGLEFVYGWNEHGGRLELLADGNDTGLRVKCDKVHGRATPAPADRAAVLREAAAYYEEVLAKATPEQDPRYWTAVRDVTLGLRRMADATQQEPTCAECDHPRGVHEEGDDPVSPGTCLACDNEDDAIHDYQQPTN